MKICKVHKLAKELCKVHRVSKKVLPIILGSLGTVKSQLKHHLAGLGLEKILGGLKTLVLIGTYSILRKPMNMDTKRKKRLNKKQKQKNPAKS